MGKTVLVADDDYEITQILSIRLKELGFFVMRSPDASHALFGAQRLRPDLIILDVTMPGGNGLAVAEMLASDAEFRNTTVIIYTGCSDDVTRARCKYLGYAYVQKSPQGWEAIKAIACQVLEGLAELARTNGLSISEAETGGATHGTTSQGTEATEASESLNSWAEIRARTCKALDSDERLRQGTQAVDGSEDAETLAGACPPAQTDSQTTDVEYALVTDAVSAARPELGQNTRFDPEHMDAQGDKTIAIESRLATILCIDDDPDISKAIKLRLAPYGVEVLRAFSGMQGFWTALDSHPDLILIDLAMPDGDGNYIFGRLRSHPLTQNVPVIILSGQVNPGIKRTMLSQGVSAYLTKPLDFPDLIRALRAHVRLADTPLVGTAQRQLMTPPATPAESKDCSNLEELAVSKTTNLPTRIQTCERSTPPASRSTCEPWRAEILAKVQLELTTRQIWQELSAKPDFHGSYQSVLRFVGRLREGRRAAMRSVDMVDAERAGAPASIQ
jgi:DNA-binding response OmpR family regulator